MARARRKRTVAIDHGTCRCIGASPARVEAFGYGRRFESSGVFFTARESLQHEKSIGRDAQARMMMKAAPIAPFVMTETDFLLEFAVVALDAPAHLDGAHQLLERNVRRQGGQEIAGRLGFAFGPFDEQPFFRARPIGVRGAHAYPREARAQRGVGAFAPGDGAIAGARQRCASSSTPMGR